MSDWVLPSYINDIGSTYKAWIDHYPEHKTANPILHEIIKKVATKKIITGAFQTPYQSGSDQRHIEELDMLFSWIERKAIFAADKLAENSGSIFNGTKEEIKHFEIAEYWGMYYTEGAGAVPHNHFPYPLCFTYYINTPEGSSPFTLEDEDIPVESGKIVFFRGTQTHQVKPCESEGRSMIAGNIIYTPNIPSGGFWEKDVESTVPSRWIIQTHG